MVMMVSATGLSARLLVWHLPGLRCELELARQVAQRNRLRTSRVLGISLEGAGDVRHDRLELGWVALLQLLQLGHHAGEGRDVG